MVGSTTADNRLFKAVVPVQLQMREQAMTLRVSHSRALVEPLTGTPLR
jgi:hypothetical protein